MRTRPVVLCFICTALFMLLAMVGCTTPMEKNSPIAATPVLEQYEYKQREKVCFFPSFTNENEKAEILSVSMEDGSFICMTTDEEQANSFINAQRTLLYFLQNNGVTLRELNYVAINFQDNFSESAKNTAYIALSSTETWQQVLVTLQALWGDFTDYGYVYAMANAIAAHLGWETEALEPAEHAAMDAFFCENPQALNLLYPAFTARYATEETIRYSKLLSCYLFEDIDLWDAFKKPIETQLDAFARLLHQYSEKIGASFSRQVCGYAYRGPYLPLCIQATYATHIVDHGYTDCLSDMYDIYEDYFSDYVTIYQTAERIDREIVEAVARFGLEDRAGNIRINWLSEYSATTKYAKRMVIAPYILQQEVYVTTIFAYLHAYYHQIAYLLNPDSVKAQTWQSLAFCEIGRLRSQYSIYGTEKLYTQDSESAELFYALTGHTYRSGTEDYFEVNDIGCYAYNDFILDCYGDVSSINSFTHYLIKDFGEDAIINLMLFPDTVTHVTGKTWETLEIEWKQALMDKYAGKEIPSWLSEYE